MSESDPTIRESRLGRGLAGVAQFDSQQLDDAMARVQERLLGGGNDDAESGERAVPSSRFVILRELGAGGCGRVYLAYDTELDRRVALKQLLRRSQADEALLIREAQLLAQLRHPNIVNVHDMTEVTASSGRPRLCIIMEYVEGVTLRTWLAEEKPTNAEILRVLCAAGRGLAAAHAAGIIHRDFKPENVIIDADGQARVLDFGLSQGPGKTSDLTASGEYTSTESDIQELAVGISGTPAYMAPERFVEPGGDVRSDMFSFAVTVWEALAGCRPFAGRTIYVLRRRMLKGEFSEIVSKRKLPGRIERVLRQALAVDPQARFVSLDELLGELERDPWLRFRRVAQVLGAVLVVVASIILIVLATRPARIVVEVVGPQGPLPPSGVWVDEQPLDLAANGASGESPPGVHRLRVEAPGMQPSEAIVTLARGDLHRRTVVVRPQQGTLEIEATPVGASVWIDGVEYGSRLRNHMVPVGKHELRIHLQGYFETRRELIVEADKTVDQYISLAPAVVWSRRHTGIRYKPQWIGDLSGDGRSEVAHRFFNVLTVTDPWNDRDLWTMRLGDSNNHRLDWSDVDGDGVDDLITVESLDNRLALTVWSHPTRPGQRPRVMWRIEAEGVKPVVPLLIAVADERPDTVVVADFPLGHTRAFELKSGRERWHRTGEKVYAQVVAKRVDGPATLIQNEGHYLRALDSSTGQVRFVSGEPVSKLDVGDVDGDHNDEVLVFASGRPDSEHAALNKPLLSLLSGEDGSRLWARETHGWSRIETVRPGDVDVVALHDGPDTEPGEVAILGASGETAWSTEVPAKTRISRWSVAGEPEQLVALHAGGVEFRNLDDGTIVDQMATAGTPAGSALQLDWDGDGHQELVVGCDDRRLVSFRPGIGQVNSVTLDSPIERLVDGGDVDRDGFPELLLLARGPKVVSAPQHLWWRLATDGLRATPIVDDFNGDGRLQVASVGDYTNLSTVHFFDAENGRLLYRGATDVHEAVRPAAVITRPDGGADLLAHSAARLVRFSGHDGSVLAEAKVASSYTSPTLYDVDHDGELEVVLTPWRDKDPVEIRRLADLSQFTSIPLDGGGWATPYIYTVPGTTRPMMVFALHSGDVVALQGTGERWRVALGFRHFLPPFVFDLDSDGTPELLTHATGAGKGTLDLVALRRSDGVEVRRWPGMGSPLGGVVLLDNEVVAEGPWLVVATQRRGVVAMSLDGKVRWRYEPQPGGDNPRGTAPIRLVDTEGDGRFELLVPLRDGTLYALDAQTGAIRWRMATGDPNIEAAPVAVDLDGDGALEVLLAGHDRQLLAIRPPRNERR